MDYLEDDSELFGVAFDFECSCGNSSPHKFITKNFNKYSKKINVLCLYCDREWVFSIMVVEKKIKGNNEATIRK